jgi:hypothetical protein
MVRTIRFTYHEYQGDSELGERALRDRALVGSALGIGRWWD